MKAEMARGTLRAGSGRPAGGAAAIAAATGHADPNLANLPPHRHWINSVQVGPDICDNRGDPGIQQAFNQFHNNLHIATASSIGPAAPRVCTTELHRTSRRRRAR
jgi:hypothetical protein